MLFVKFIYGIQNIVIILLTTIFSFRIFPSAFASVIGRYPVCVLQTTVSRGVDYNNNIYYIDTSVLLENIGQYTTRKILKNYIPDPSGLFSIISHVSLSMT